MKTTHVAKKEKPLTSLEATFLYWWRVLAHAHAQPEAHVVLFKAKRYEYDFVWSDEMIAVELQGGTYQKRISRNGDVNIGTGHSTPSGIRRDATKSNLAQQHGWICLHYTKEMLDEDPQGVIGQIVEILQMRRLS